jgi:hypothetical protein
MKRKCISLFLSLFSLIYALCFTACGKTATATVLSAQEDTIVISITTANDGAKFIDALKQLQETNKLDFEISGGMIVSVNGKENVVESANSGYSWMIYTSNSELSYPEYGSKTYKNTVCYSAAFGAEGLVVQAGETVILSYDKWSF